MKRLVKHGSEWLMVEETGEFRPLDAALGLSPPVSESETSPVTWPDEDEVHWPEE